jgi:hypothetical protein
MRDFAAGILAFTAMVVCFLIVVPWIVLGWFHYLEWIKAIVG